METFIIAFLVNLILSFAVGAFASQIGRSFGGYTALSIFFTPLFALLALIVVGKTNEQIAKDEIEIGKMKASLCPSEQIPQSTTVETSTSTDEGAEQAKIENSATLTTNEEDGSWGIVVVIIIIILIMLGCCILMVK